MTKTQKSIFTASAFFILILASFFHSSFSKVQPWQNIWKHYMSPPYVENEILVKFKPRISSQLIQTMIAYYGSEKIEKIPRINVYRLKLPSSSSVEEAVELFNQNPDVEYAEPNHWLYLASSPNDEYFEYQWALENTGQRIGPEQFDFPEGTPGSDINANEAWETQTGSENTLVGIVDTGVDIGHPDLKNNILSSGRDFANDDYNASDDHGHGTHVAGIIGAQGNNNIGVCGVCWKCKMLPVKVFLQNAKGNAAWVVSGIIWAADHDVRVINMSLGGPDVVANQALEDAIKYAYEKNIVLVAAAGNDGTEGVWYPAAYDDYVLAAAATDYNDNYIDLELTDGWFGSNYGPEVDVAAPGLDILSTWGRGLWRRGRPGWSGYNYGNKTSMATAFVSGLAALIISHYPWLENWQVMEIIRHSADDINSSEHPGEDIYIGFGRINAKRALEIARVFERRREQRR
ncbi:MAG: S8 family serine peptidase [Candidatus Aminicenantes bacterium]|nr:S8 family serine peptidase [Candidatus Aminicenantes bacterium]